MPRCPICGSPRVVVVLSTSPHARCIRCRAVWVPDGSRQRAIRPGPRAPHVAETRPAGA